MTELTVVVACQDTVIPMGDGGNARALAARAGARGVAVRVLRHLGNQPLPLADLVVVGGADESGLCAVATALRAAGLLEHAARGGHLLAVNSGYQVLLTSFEDERGRTQAGLDLIPGRATREELVEGVVVGRNALGPRLPQVSGFETHFGRVHLAAGASPLSWLLSGVGNGEESRADGFASDRIVGTFVHGPLLGRNPALADLLLDRLLPEAVLRQDRPATWGERAREARISEDLLDPSGWGGERYGRRLPIYSRLRPPSVTQLGDE